MKKEGIIIVPPPHVTLGELLSLSRPQFPLYYYSCLKMRLNPLSPNMGTGLAPTITQGVC